jgi:DNA polymerase-3 subunit beta
MKATLPQPALKAIITRGGAAAAKGSKVAILNFARLTATGDTLALATTDQDRFAEAVTAATIETPGTICVDAAALTTLIDKHPKGAMIELSVEEDRLVVVCGRSKIKMPTLDPKGFPAWADQKPIANFALPATEFERAMGRVRFAVSKSTLHYFLQGVLFDCHDGSLHFVASDMNIVAVSGMAAPDGAAECPKIIVPAEGIDAALKVFKDAGQIDIAVSAKSISFSADSLRLSSRLIEGTFVPYEKVIPARGNPALTFKRADFAACLDRANCLAEDKGEFSSITARPDGDTLRLEARNHKGGEAVEELPAAIGEGFKTFGFDPRYGAQFLAALNVSEITIEQSDPNVAHLIYAADAPDFVGILAPVQVVA